MNKKYCNENDVVIIIKNGEELIDNNVMRKINHDFI